MDNDRFEEISKNGLAMLSTVFSPFNLIEGETITYNAYLDGREVVVVGYQYPDLDRPGHTLTKPLAILVDPDLFNHLEVDGEGYRVGPDGEDQAPLLHDPA